MECKLAWQKSVSSEFPLRSSLDSLIKSIESCHNQIRKQASWTHVDCCFADCAEALKPTETLIDQIKPHILKFSLTNALFAHHEIGGPPGEEQTTEQHRVTEENKLKDFFECSEEADDQRIHVHRHLQNLLPLTGLSQVSHVFPLAHLTHTCQIAIAIVFLKNWCKCLK